jgi:hypothetical protein
MFVVGLFVGNLMLLCAHLCRVSLSFVYFALPSFLPLCYISSRTRMHALQQLLMKQIEQ